MTAQNLFITAIRSLGKNKMRSALTSLGVIIGVASVILMMGIGNSARVAVRDKIFNYGANAMSVRSRPNRFSAEDLEKLRHHIIEIKNITPVVGNDTILVKFSSMNLYTKVVGVSNEFFEIKEWPVHYGRYFTEMEILSNEKVAIIGNTVRVTLFGYQDPVGKTILANNVPYRVIGSLNEVGQALSGRDPDNVVLIPYTTASIKLLGTKNFDEIYVSTHSESLVDSMEKKLKEYIIREHKKPVDYKIRTSKDELKMVEYVSKTLSILLAGIASISLIVGGIGIMNIMLVSVSERTREIGIRRAIGAKKKHILIQFLIEAVTLSAGGGVVGILIAVVLYYTITLIVGWPFLLSFFSIIISFFFSGAVGVFFGYYPARKASNLKPIEALRFE